MKKKLSLIIAIIMILSIVMIGCGQQATTNEPKEDVIKIGVFEPLTGANAAGGELELEGIKLANKLYPTVLGKTVELVILDNKSDKVEAANAATRLVDQDKVPVVLGSWGSGSFHSSWCCLQGSWCASNWNFLHKPTSNLKQ